MQSKHLTEYQDSCQNLSCDELLVTPIDKLLSIVRKWGRGRCDMVRLHYNCSIYGHQQNFTSRDMLQSVRLQIIIPGCDVLWWTMYMGNTVPLLTGWLLRDGGKFSNRTFFHLKMPIGQNWNVHQEHVNSDEISASQGGFKGKPAWFSASLLTSHPPGAGDPELLAPLQPAKKATENPGLELSKKKKICFDSLPTHPPNVNFPFCRKCHISDSSFRMGTHFFFRNLPFLVDRNSSSSPALWLRESSMLSGPHCCP